MPSPIRAWAQLIRIPNTLTACSDVIAGFAITAGAWYQSTQGANSQVGASLVAIAISSICLYWSGMILNDVHDVEIDRKQRRHGPLVDGRIRLQTASRAGWLLLAAGIGLAALAAFWIPKGPDSSRSPWIVVSTSVCLACVIVAYDSRLKATLAGPLLMGLCRGLNLLTGILLGACIEWPMNEEWRSIAMAISGHIAFVVGITLAARREGVLQQSQLRIALGWSVSLIGVILIASCSMLSYQLPLYLEPYQWFPAMVAILMFPWMRRALLSIVSPGVGTLVPAIKQAILSIIFLDAALALQFAGNPPGILVCSLAIPTFAMSRYFRMT